MEPPFQAATASIFEPPIDDGLVARCDRDGNWVNSLWWENTTHISNHHPADCLHSFVNLAACRTAKGSSRPNLLGRHLGRTSGSLAG
jgi:hypothetical protein